MLKTYKRCVILQFYDKDGIVDEYIFSLIRQLALVAQTIIFVSNSEISNNDMMRLKGCVDRLVVRENEGYDAGSYKEILVNCLGKDGIRKYDEIVLCNTTFFGFLVPIEELFIKMKYKQCDFWGIGHNDGGIFTYSQGYFLVFRKNILFNGDLYEFFNNIPTINGRLSSSIYYEVGIYQHMLKKGYKYCSYVEKTNYYIFGSCAHSVLKDGYPILKKRAFAPEFYDENNLLYLLQHIMSLGLYDVDMIIDSVNRSYHLNFSKSLIEKSCVAKQDVRPIVLGKCSASYVDIYNFMETNENVYIFGIGFYGMFLLDIMKDTLQNTKGIVVSNDKIGGLLDAPYIKDELTRKGATIYYKHMPVLELGGIDEKNSAIVVALDYKNSKETKQLFKNFNNVLFLWKQI